MSEKSIYNWKFVILATALSGASALIYEIISSRILLLFFSSTITSMTIVLIIFLGGLSIGSALMTIFKKYFKNNALVFGIIQILVAFYTIIIFSQFVNLPYLFDFLENFINSVLLIQLISAFIFIFIPTILLGSIFPLATAMLTHKDDEHISQKIGWLYTLDVLGAVLGAAIAGFYILPNYGNILTIVFAGSLNILAAAIVFPKTNKIKVLWLVLTIIFCILSIIIADKQTYYRVDKKAANTNLSYLQKNDINFFDEDVILWQKSSAWGTITITEEEKRFGMDTILSIDDRGQCSVLEHESEALIATGILQDIQNPKVLNIGLGCGFTLAAILENNPQQVTVAEINPTIYEAADFFRDYTNDAINDPRVDIVIQDGAEFLRTTDQKFDAIVIDIENPAVAHSSPLYTVEYLQYAKQHLNENGKIGLWAYHSQNDKYLKSLLTTFQVVFDNVVFAEFEDPGYVYLFVASDGPVSLESIDTKGNTQELLDKIQNIEDVAPNTLNYPALIKYFR